MYIKIIIIAKEFLVVISVLIIWVLNIFVLPVFFYFQLENSEKEGERERERKKSRKSPQSFQQETCFFFIIKQQQLK